RPQLVAPGCGFQTRFVLRAPASSAPRSRIKQQKEPRMSLSLDSGALNSRASDDGSIWEKLGKAIGQIEKPETPFVTGEGDANAVDPNDVKQDGYGSCGVLSTLETIAQQNPAAIQGMIQDNGDGTYTVTFQ